MSRDIKFYEVSGHQVLRFQEPFMLVHSLCQKKLEQRKRVRERDHDLSELSVYFGSHQSMSSDFCISLNSP